MAAPILPPRCELALINAEIAWLADLAGEDARLDYATVYALIAHLQKRRLALPVRSAAGPSIREAAS